MTPVLASTTSMGGRLPLTGVLEAYEAAGIEAVELGTAHDPGEVDVSAITQFGFACSVHNFFPRSDPDHLFNIASLDEFELEKTLAIATGAVDICHRVSGLFYGMHAGFRSDASASSLGAPLSYSRIAPHESALETMVHSIRRVCDYARPLGVDVLVENHVLAPFNLVDGRNELLLMCDEDEAVWVCREVDRQNFGILVDLGHLKVTCKTLDTDPQDFIAAVRPWLRAFHLSDNDGASDQTLPFDDGVWFRPLLAGFEQLPWVIESNVADVEEMARLVGMVSAWR